MGEFVEALGELEAGLRRQDDLARAFAGADQTSQGEWLNHIAAAVAADTPRTLDLLLSIVDTHRLAIPAIRRLVASDAAVDEVAQDVLVAVAQSISSFGGRSSFRTWLNGVARNQTLQHIRRESRTRTTAGITDSDSEDLAPAMRISSMVASRMVLTSVIEELPDHYRDAVVLRDVDQCSYEEIASQLAIELNTVRSRISRGRAMIASAIAV